ncbi:hypothetical protein HJC23_001966 [Cyclotella cryptica]|uniref:AB hydrolase-1 domain-containing protein n=1 Tax=Cyclotella cryptica TaxID=29204 RepID=A0ABD3PN40_9STRA
MRTTPARAMRRTTMARTRMAPSTGSTAFRAVGGAGRGIPTSLPSSMAAQDTSGMAPPRHPVATQQTPREDEPNLYNIPPHLSATYRPMPWYVHSFIGAASLAVVGRRTISHWIQQGSVQFVDWTVKKTLVFLLRYVILWSASHVAVQEGFYPPSRVTTQSLADTATLPSLLSHYETITPISTARAVNHRVPIGVHSIQYTNLKNNKYAAIYLHHGFGASSLSWLPVLPSLVDRLGARVGMAHDAPGFGFTDRPDADSVGGLKQYRTENSVGIGLALLQNALKREESCFENGANVEEEGAVGKNLAIFGHSMGAKAALLMALSCSVDEKLRLQPRLVVLVAPALEGVTLPSRRRKESKAEIPDNISGVRKWLASFWIVWRKIFVDYPFRYVLRRVVGAKNFWRNGLSQAWGDPKRLTDSDVLRFQWPSIGKGWERGLISFARGAQSSDDAQLLRDVLNLPNTTVLLLYGTKDNVVTVNESVLQLLKSNFPTVKVLRMEGLGHDPFEEDKEAFVSELEKLI